jgi:hypothetical protein
MASPLARGIRHPGAADAVSEIVDEKLDQVTTIIQEAMQTVTGEPVSAAEALEELAQHAEGKAQEGGEE